MGEGQKSGGPVVRWELKLQGGKVVEWDGTDGEDAARRFCDSERVAGRSATVVASRPADRHGLFVLGRGKIIG